MAKFLRLEFVRDIYLGAEAEIYLCDWLGFRVVVKRRKSKGYRRKELDKRIIASRTVREASMLSEARGIGVPTPFVLHVNPTDGIIVMQYLDGPTVSELASKASLKELKPIFHSVGNSLGILHSNRIVHGDPTTSNMILRGKDVFMVDFGLASRASGIEQMGEDLHVLYMALTSAHHSRSKRLFSYLVSGYGKRLGATSSAILKRVEQISKRGRYVERVS